MLSNQSAKKLDRVKSSSYSIRRNLVSLARTMAQTIRRKILATTLSLTTRVKWSTRRGNRASTKAQRSPTTTLRSSSPTSAKGSLAWPWTSSPQPFPQALALVKRTSACWQTHTNRSPWNWITSSIPIPRKASSIVTTQLWSHSSWRSNLRVALRRHHRAVHRSYHPIIPQRIYSFLRFLVILRRIIIRKRTSNYSIEVGRPTIQAT